MVQYCIPNYIPHCFMCNLYIVIAGCAVKFRVAVQNKHGTGQFTCCTPSADISGVFYNGNSLKYVV